ncbi:hypothetical protein RvY_04949 [Ramazzottius varieornatus]|uniref:Uncharacterized protein n=1 Tax=Ramazzottius varieornatus TaxID=947166 RepID=A0A1D1V395_RAMVA|nr:hypothetical protein RvY_04949 [Ramazzottius varieornatus]
MTQISSNVGNCIQWVNLGQAGLLSTYPSRNFAIISRNGGPGTPSPTCFSYPGMITQQEGRGQYVAIQAACLGNVRNVMRILSYLLGLRPEHNKPNRDSFITVNTAAATPSKVFLVPNYKPKRLFTSKRSFTLVKNSL